MIPRGSISALAISFTLLGLMVWVASAHPADGKLFAQSPAYAQVRVVSQPTAEAQPHAINR